MKRIDFLAAFAFAATALAIAPPISSSETETKSCCSKASSRAAIIAGQLSVAVALAAVADNVAGDDKAQPPVNAANWPAKPWPEGMVWVPGGEFSMGSTDPLARPDEKPIHRVRVDGFWMDATELTNAQFRAFVEATGYKTIAERPVDWEELKKQVPEGTPKPPDEMLKPGSLVFTPPDHPVDLNAYEQWWTWTTGADWRHPEGPPPASTIEGKDAFPVVQIAYVDAVAYCKWAGKRLPTEAEREFAARGGLDHKVNVWGDEPIDPKRANIWQGHFPDTNNADDGFVLAAPVKSFPPNGYGLYDMAGNVWEWCSDLYRPDTYARQLLAAGGGAASVIVNPTGPETSLDPRNPNSPESRVHRGGSFLCNDSYCASYRPSARMACPPDTGLQHLGFRCVMTQDAWEKKSKQATAPAPPTSEPDAK